MIFPTSKTASSPSPLQWGQAPLGELNERCAARGPRRPCPSRAHQVARVETLLPGPVVVDGHRALALAHRLLQRGHHPVAGLPRRPRGGRPPGRWCVSCSGRGACRRYFADLAIDARIDIPLLGQRLGTVRGSGLAALDDGGHQGDLTPGEARENQLGDLVIGIVDHLLARHGRIGRDARA